jgi:hypothetical protein
MRNVQDLPNEILLNVFRLGCDDQEFDPDALYKFNTTSHARKRKRLIEDARLVCFRWHQLVSLRNLPYGCYFWSARLSLSLRNTGKLPSPDLAAPNIFLRRLIQFRKSLSTAQGCDLIVELDTGGIAKTEEAIDGSINAVDSYQNTSLEDQLSIRLFLSGAFEILQKRNQILAMRVRVAQAPLHKHMVELLASLEAAPRLKYLQVYPLKEVEYTGPCHYPP